MKTQFDIKTLLEIGKINNELDFERALIADRKLRVLSKDNPKYKTLRNKLKNLIEVYENENWSSSSRVNEKKLRESDVAELISEKERLFINKRKELIKIKLKQLNLKQQDFGIILGHSSKSYISELMNGINPFSLKDLIIINRLLKIDLINLVPTFLPQTERVKIKSSIEKLENPKLKLSQNDFALT